MIRKALTDESIKNLRRLQGEFRLPESRVRGAQWMSVLLIILGGISVWFFFQRLQGLPAPFQMFSRQGSQLIRFGIMGGACLILGQWKWRRAGHWYRFGSGQVQLLSRSGSVLWAEDVLGIVKGTMS